MPEITINEDRSRRGAGLHHPRGRAQRRYPDSDALSISSITRRRERAASASWRSRARRRCSPRARPPSATAWSSRLPVETRPRRAQDGRRAPAERARGELPVLRPQHGLRAERFRLHDWASSEPLPGRTPDGADRPQHAGARARQRQVHQVPPLRHRVQRGTAGRGALPAVPRLRRPCRAGLCR